MSSLLLGSVNSDGEDENAAARTCACVKRHRCVSSNVFILRAAFALGCRRCGGAEDEDRDDNVVLVMDAASFR